MNDYVRTSYLNGCKVYADGKSVVFDCGDKVCRLTSDYELTPYLPFYAAAAGALRYIHGGALSVIYRGA